MNCGELKEFNYAELIYYKLRQSITKWIKNYKAKYIYHEVGQALLQSRAVSRYYKVGEEIL